MPGTYLLCPPTALPSRPSGKWPLAEKTLLAILFYTLIQGRRQTCTRVIQNVTNDGLTCTCRLHSLTKFRRSFVAIECDHIFTVVLDCGARKVAYWICWWMKNFYDEIFMCRILLAKPTLSRKQHLQMINISNKKWCSGLGVVKPAGHFLIWLELFLPNMALANNRISLVTLPS